MKLFSYIVARDFGFAPNPFFGICTLATCKPIIRKVACRGDWIVGISSKKNGPSRRVVFVMCVTGAMSFEDYWNDGRFRSKKPIFQGSRKYAYGDNVYHKKDGFWLQAASHHSMKDGATNIANLEWDTSVDRILYSEEFAYWGRSGPEVPDNFLNWLPGGISICPGRGHKSNFPQLLIVEFARWFQTLGQRGYLGEPTNWK